jgi:AcrR family transcriptional regulator
MDDGRRDRRVLRTRQMLQEALVALILEKGYEAVTVQEVLDRANVGRATFYAHFSNKEALLLSVFTALRDALYEAIATLSPGRAARFGEGVGLFQVLFEHAEQHCDLYRALLRSREGAVLLRYLRAVLALPLREHLEAGPARRGSAPTADVGFVVAALVSAVLGVLIWWLEEDAPHSPAEMDRMLERLLVPGVAWTFNVAQRWEPLLGH